MSKIIANIICYNLLNIFCNNAIIASRVPYNILEISQSSPLFVLQIRTVQQSPTPRLSLSLYFLLPRILQEHISNLLAVFRFMHCLRKVTFPEQRL